jgi:hypothetical protein
MLSSALRSTLSYTGPSAKGRTINEYIFELLNLIPEIFHSFYRNLPCNETIKIVFQILLAMVKRRSIFMGFYVIVSFTYLFLVTTDNLSGISDVKWGITRCWLL